MFCDSKWENGFSIKWEVLISLIFPEWISKISYGEKNSKLFLLRGNEMAWDFVSECMNGTV